MVVQVMEGKEGKAWCSRQHMSKAAGQAAGTHACWRRLAAVGRWFPHTNRTHGTGGCDIGRARPATRDWARAVSP